MKAKIVYLICFVFLISCTTSVYSKLDKNFEDNRWQKTDVKKYNFNIEEENQFYSLAFKFSYIYDYQFPKIPIIVTLEKPSGAIEKTVVDVVIKNQSGKELGDCAGDICDLSQIIKNKIKLQKGNYTVTITNNFKGNYLPNVLAIGFEIEKTK